jgi:hypothetical protein
LREPHLRRTDTHGKSQEEAQAQDEQTQASQTLEIQPSQKAHLAEIAD